MKFAPLGMPLGLLVVFAAGEARAQAWTSAYTSPTATGNCAGLSASLSSEFTIEPIVSRALFTNPQPARIVKMTFWLNPATHKADIILSEKGGNGTAGRILYYNASATPNPTLTAIGTIPGVYIGFNEAGVLGLAVNPRTFAQDNFLYVLYTTGADSSKSATNGWRVSRFKLNATTRAMNLASEKILMHIPAGTRERWHTGSSLRFDDFGNLYIGSGDNEATANGPANTADLRGGILRITPDSTVARGYTVPAGNFGDYWATQWTSLGLAARAAAYRDTSIVKPEIYVKGSRNPYSFGVDPYRLGWIAWSECGPDRENERGEEHNFTTRPVFSGWPFWVGNGVRQTGYAANYNERPEPSTTAQWGDFNPSGMSTQVPVNNWAQAAGYDTLPPMHVPYASQSSGCAMGGPIVRYDGRVNNAGKLPPHLDNVIFTHNFSTSHLSYGIKLNPDSAKTTGTAVSVFTMAKSTTAPSLRNVIEFAHAPDGMLYAVDWGAGCCNGDRTTNSAEGISRIRYTGTCQDPGLTPVSVSGKPAFREEVSWLKVGAGMFSVFAQGPHEAAILDVQGRTLRAFRGEGPKNYDIPDLGARGVYVLRVKTRLGTNLRPLAGL